MEEIDIIELLKRVKEGKAPKRIEIEGVIYIRNTDEQFCDCVDLMYFCNTSINETNWWIDDKGVTLDTKIKILDKPIIEELEINDEDSFGHQIYLIENKINEIIKWINKENKDE